jgi:LSD1 subclass zinc finger protein
MPEPLKCQKCGAPIEPDPGARIVKCAYCDSQIFLDRSGAGFFYIIPFMLNASQAQGIFRRWTAGSNMARDLEALASISIIKQAYFPVYMFKRDLDGKETVMVRPARSTTLPGMRNLKVPAGDLKLYDQKFSTSDVEVLQPELDMAAYLGELPGKALEQSLVFFPVWEMTYAYKGLKYTAVVDGSAGEIFATDYPPRKTAPFVLVAGVGFVLFFIEGIFVPLGIVLALATAPVIFYAGYYVARTM